jgi:hypothetical protein
VNGSQSTFLTENLAYVPKSTRTLSLSNPITTVLTGPHKEIDNKDTTQKQFISTQAFHRTPGGRVRETTAGERFRPRNLKTFDPGGQCHARDSTCKHQNHTYSNPQSKPCCVESSQPLCSEEQDEFLRMRVLLKIRSESANRNQSHSLPDEEHGTLVLIAPTQLNPRTEDQRKQKSCGRTDSGPTAADPERSWTNSSQRRRSFGRGQPKSTGLKIRTNTERL